MKLIKRKALVKCKCDDCKKTIKADVDTKFTITTQTNDFVLCNECFDKLKKMMLWLNDIGDLQDAIYEI